MRSIFNLFSVFKYINHHPLAGKHKIIAYSKFVYWQLTQLITPQEKTVPFIGNTFLSVAKGMKGATGNIWLGLHDFCEMGFLMHFLQKEDLFADVGANIGSYSIIASGVAGATTIAFEPSLDTFLQLQKNIQINHLGNKIIPFNLALGSKVDKLNFTTALDTVNHVVAGSELNTTDRHIEVQVDMLDNFVTVHGTPILIKIDVEGFETEVINGMEQILRHQNLKAIIIELNGSGLRYGYNERMIDKKLRLHGFEPHLYDPFNRIFQLSPDFGSHNTLYLRDMSFIKERVLKATKVEVFNEIF